MPYVLCWMDVIYLISFDNYTSLKGQVITLLGSYVGSEKSRFDLICSPEGTGSLTTKTVQSTALSLQGVDHVHCRYRLPFGVLTVGDSIPDDVF